MWLIKAAGRLKCGTGEKKLLYTKWESFKNVLNS